MYAFKKEIGNLGGILTVWDPNIFTANCVIEKDSFIAIKGLWKDVGTELILVNIYGPQTEIAKKKMWFDLSELLKYNNAMWVLLGDFNEVRFFTERKNTEFCERNAKYFNEFIKDNALLDLPLGGRTYTRISDDSQKFSKLDRFLVSENFIENWPSANVTIIDKKHTDHCPLILKDGDVDFGPKPVKVFDEWLKHKESYDIIKVAWNTKVKSYRPDCIFHDKLKLVKQELEKWYSTSHGKLGIEIEELTTVVNEWEKKAETSELSEAQHNKWMAD
ncbi:uncharacterized protein [Rutidosis leptorrhynchoides]|uniref:uncharacterized protein n=1 Tax=Rutidosis leptorrhynchoides TaxID=125765 RepID=UPI003A995881